MIPITESRTISEADALYTAEITKAPLGAFVYVYDENHNPINGADIYINGSLSGTTNQYGRQYLPGSCVWILSCRSQKNRVYPFKPYHRRFE